MIVFQFLFVEVGGDFAHLEMDDFFCGISSKHLEMVQETLRFFFNEIWNKYEVIGWKTWEILRETYHVQGKHGVMSP